MIYFARLLLALAIIEGNDWGYLILKDLEGIDCGSSRPRNTCCDIGMTRRNFKPGISQIKV
jgi:hypothetical protein